MLVGAHMLNAQGDSLDKSGMAHRPTPRVRSTVLPDFAWQGSISMPVPEQQPNVPFEQNSVFLEKWKKERKNKVQRSAWMANKLLSACACTQARRPSNRVPAAMRRMCHDYEYIRWRDRGWRCAKPSSRVKKSHPRITTTPSTCTAATRGSSGQD